jgi:hypothetical protein
MLLLAAWLSGGLLALARLSMNWLRLEQALHQSEPLQNVSITTDAAALALQAKLATPQLATLDDLASPFAARGRRIVLPRWACELLDREQLRAMLAHETAHLARRDPLWKLATAVWCSLLWFLPPAALARRRLDETAELACDAWAARHLGDGRSLAECLAECAERRLDGFESWLAPAMAHRESPLLERIDHLIGGTPMNTTLSYLRAGSAAVLALALAAVVLPGFGTSVVLAESAPPNPPSPPSPPAPPVPPKTSGNQHISISSDVGLFGKRHQSTNVEVSDNGHSYRANIRGEIAFTDHDDDVASLSDSASFGETQGGVTRRVDYKNTNGKIERRYFVDEREQPIDEVGRAWLATIIPTVIHETAIGVEARVKRLYASGGADAVLADIDSIKSDYARGAYLKQLFAQGKLTPGEVTRALGLIDGIGSDYERRNALAGIAAAAPLDAAQQKLVIGQAEKIGSDYERAELLVGMLPNLAPDASLREAWLHAAAGLGSDYEHRRTLNALLDTGHLDDAQLAEVINAADTIGSDYERRELLVSTIRRIGDGDRVAGAYGKAVAGIGSDYERREALLALIHAPNFGTAGSRAVLDAAGGIGSDYECREVLIALARVMPGDAGLIARYREVARRLSDSERGAAEKALDRFAS